MPLFASAYRDARRAEFAMPMTPASDAACHQQYRRCRRCQNACDDDAMPLMMIAQRHTLPPFIRQRPSAIRHDTIYDADAALFQSFAEAAYAARHYFCRIRER